MSIPRPSLTLRASMLRMLRVTIFLDTIHSLQRAFDDASVTPLSGGACNLLGAAVGFPTLT